jgi:predicted deacylase
MKIRSKTTEINGYLEDRANLKKVLIITGLHGNELTPLYAGKLLKDMLTEETVESLNLHSIKIIHGANPAGIVAGTREVANTATRDLNRDSNKANWEVSGSHFRNLIDGADIIIDIHSSPNCDEFMLIDEDEQSRMFVNICSEIGCSYGLRYSSKETLKAYANEKPDKLGFTIELNGMNKIDVESAKMGSRIVYNLIEKLSSENITNFKKRWVKDKTDNINDNVMIEIPAIDSGIISVNYEMGDQVNKGDVLFYIFDLDYTNKKDVICPVDGRIIYRNGRDFVTAGDEVYGIQPLHFLK